MFCWKSGSALSSSCYRADCRGTHMWTCSQLNSWASVEWCIFVEEVLTTVLWEWERGKRLHMIILCVFSSVSVTVNGKLWEQLSNPMILKYPSVRPPDLKIVRVYWLNFTCPVGKLCSLCIECTMASRQRFWHALYRNIINCTFWAEM